MVLKRQPPVLEVSQLGIRRGQTVILEDVNWRVQRDQHWVILGANGSGKTSLLSALTGYLMPTTGDITLLGQCYGRSDWRELRKRVGIVSSSIRQMMADEEPALETVVSGKYAMIDFWGRPAISDRSKARRILRQIECEHLEDRSWRVLSQGERQRILIGRALMARPRVLILDEPCAGLDPAARERFLEFLQRLGGRRSAPTMIFVTHHVEEIMPVFSHVMILKNGRILASGNKGTQLNAGNLSKAFDAPVKLRRSKNRYQIAVGSDSRLVV